MTQLNLSNCLLIIVVFIAVSLLLIIKRKCSYGGYLIQQEGTASDYKCGLNAVLPIICVYRKISLPHVSSMVHQFSKGDLIEGEDNYLVYKSGEWPPYSIDKKTLRYMYNFLRDESKCKEVLDINTPYPLQTICDLNKLDFYFKPIPDKGVDFNGISFLRAMLNIDADYSEISYYRSLNVTWTFNRMIKYEYQVGDIIGTNLCCIQLQNIADSAIEWIITLCTSFKMEDGMAPIIENIILGLDGHYMCLVYNNSNSYWALYNDSGPPEIIPYYAAKSYLEYKFNKMSIETLHLFMDIKDSALITQGPSVETDHTLNEKGNFIYLNNKVKNIQDKDEYIITALYPANVLAYNVKDLNEFIESSQRSFGYDDWIDPNVPPVSDMAIAQE